jgi:hypothetical protein
LGSFCHIFLLFSENLARKELFHLMQIMSKYYKLKEIALTRILFDCVRFHANPNRNNGNNFKGYDRLKVEISVMEIEKLE